MIGTGRAAAFGRNAMLAAGDLSVSTTCFGMVTVSGVVRSWAEHDNAIAGAWAAPEVTEVDDRIVVAVVPECPERYAKTPIFKINDL